MFNILKLLKLDSILDSLTGYIETKIEYYKIQFKEEIARALSLLIFVLLLSIVMLLFLIFLSFFAVALLNHLFGSQYLGFLIMAFIYLILGLIIYVFRDNLIFGKVYREFFKDNSPKNE
jgi:hypothetical protein